MGIDYTFELLLSEDGSGRGAALVAAVLKRDEQKAMKGNYQFLLLEMISFITANKLKNKLLTIDHHTDGS